MTCAARLRSEHLTARRLYTPDLRQGCVVIDQVAGIARQQVSPLAGFGIREPRK
jgi:hypothetical protein